MGPIQHWGSALLAEDSYEISRKLQIIPWHQISILCPDSLKQALNAEEEKWSSFLNVCLLLMDSTGKLCVQQHPPGKLCIT